VLALQQRIGLSVDLNLTSRIVLIVYSLAIDLMTVSDCNQPSLASFISESTIQGFGKVAILGSMSDGL